MTNMVQHDKEDNNEAAGECLFAAPLQKYHLFQ